MDLGTIRCKLSPTEEGSVALDASGKSLTVTPFNEELKARSFGGTCDLAAVTAVKAAGYLTLGADYSPDKGAIQSVCVYDTRTMLPLGKFAAAA